MLPKNRLLKNSVLCLGGIIVLISISVAVYLLLIAPSFIGKTGPDGAILKKYIEPSELKKLTENPDDSIWIIDVRSEKNYSKGHIPTAKSFYSGSIMSKLDELPKDKHLLLYCETGGRVEAVTKKLKNAGYTRYMNWGGNYRWPYERTTTE